MQIDGVRAFHGALTPERARGALRAAAAGRAERRQRLRRADGDGEGGERWARSPPRSTASAASTGAACERRRPQTSAPGAAGVRLSAGRRGVDAAGVEHAPAGPGRAHRLPRPEHHRASLRPRARGAARRADRVLHPPARGRRRDPQGRRHEGRQGRPDPRARADARRRQRRREPARDVEELATFVPSDRRHPSARPARQPAAVPAPRRDLRAGGRGGERCAPSFDEALRRGRRAGLAVARRPLPHLARSLDDRLARHLHRAHAGARRLADGARARPEERYPTVELPRDGAGVELVLLPSEPFRFRAKHVPELEALLPGVAGIARRRRGDVVVREPGDRRDPLARGASRAISARDDRARGS